MAAVFRHYEIKQSSNFLVLAHVLAHSEGHARRIYEDVTGADHKLVKTYVVLETNIPPHVDTILPGDRHRSRDVNTLYRDQDTGREFHSETKPEQEPTITKTALLIDLKSIRTRLANITVINKSVPDRDEAFRLLNVLIEILDKGPSLFLPEAKDYKTAVSDVQSVVKWLDDIVNNRIAWIDQRASNAVLQLRSVLSAMEAGGKIVADAAPKDESTDAIEKMIRERGTDAAPFIGIMIDTAEQRGYDSAIQKRDEEREACAVTAWSAGMEFPEGPSRDLAMKIVERIRGRGEAYPKKDVVMMPRALAEAAEAGTILPPEHVAIPKNLAERIAYLLPFTDGHAETSTIAQYRHIVFPKVTKTVTVEVTGAEADVNAWIDNIEKDGHAAKTNLIKIDQEDVK